MSAEKYDDTLLPFLVLMRKELHANSGKGDRPGWLAMQPGQCLLEIYWHVAKLSAAVKNGDQALIAEYAADVANMAMMQADIAGLLQPSVKSQARAASATPIVGGKCKNCHGTGRDGDTGADSRTIDIECGTCHGTGLTGRYRDICTDGSRCLSGCLANEPCYLAKSTTPTAQAAPAAGAVAGPDVRYALAHADTAADLLMRAHEKAPETWRGWYDDALVHIDIARKALAAAPTPAAQADSVPQKETPDETLWQWYLANKDVEIPHSRAVALRVLQGAIRVFGNADSVLGDAHALLQEVAACFTRDDDLPDNLLPRIDAVLKARKQGGTHE